MSLGNSIFGFVGGSGMDLSGYVPYTGATQNLNLGTFTLLTAQIKATSSGGLSINANSGTQIANLGAGGGANMTLYGGLSGTSATFSSNIALTATNGTSYIQSAWQSASPAGDASNTTLWFDATGRINWRPSTGFIRTFDATGITADRSWVLPNASTTLAGLGLAQTFSALNTFSANISTPKITGGTAVGSTLTFQTTTANAGAGSDFIFLGGNNGATELARIDNSGILKCNILNNYTGSMILSAVGTAIEFRTSSTYAGQFLNNTLIISNVASTAGNIVVGLNGLGNSAAVGQFESTTKGVLFPRMTTVQKNAISLPPSGLVIYDTTLGKLCVRGASAWETITSV